MKKLLIVTVLAFGLSAVPTGAAILFPSIISPLRIAIADEIDLLTNDPALSPEEIRQLRLLRQSMRNINRRGRATLFGDVQILSGLTSSLRRAFPEGQFDPLLQQAIFDYGEVLLQSASDLQTNINALPPSSNANLASSAVSDAVQSLGQLDAETDIATGNLILARAALRLRAAEGLISRNRGSVRQGNHMTASVDGQRFNANPAGMSANYSPGTQTLTIVGRDAAGPSSGSRSIELILTDVTSGTTTHSLGAPGTGSYATYSDTTTTNSLGITSLSGNVTVTLDTVTGQASGRFSFEGGDTFSGQDTVRVSGGDFAARLLTF